MCQHAPSVFFLRTDYTEFHGFSLQNLRVYGACRMFRYFMMPFSACIKLLLFSLSQYSNHST